MDRVIMESQCTFLPILGLHLIHVIRAFSQFLLPILKVRLIYECDLYTGIYGIYK